MQRAISLNNLTVPTEINKLTSYLRDIYKNIPLTTTGTAVPTITPGQIGDRFLDLTHSKFYVAFGTTSSADWKIMN